MRKILRFLALLLVTLVCMATLSPSTDAAGSAPRYPVIFIPGIGGSEIHSDQELVWINTGRLVGAQLPIFNLLNLNWMLPLRLQPDGATPYYASGYTLRLGGLLRTGLTDVYGDFLRNLGRYGYVEGQNLFVYPYDWRHDLTGTGDRLGLLVNRVRQQTGAGKVVLVGHSLGGLIARDYVVRGGAPAVAATVSLATPWLGSPMAYRAVEYGWDMGIKIPGTRWSALAPRDVQLLSKNFASVYMLAPARQYFDQYPEGYLNRKGRNLTHAESLAQGMAPHNQGLAARGPVYYDRLLDGRDHGVQQFILAGTGRSTVVGFTERTDWLGMKLKTERTDDGDEVVPLRSADLGYSRDPSLVSRYIGSVRAVAYVEAQHTFLTQSAVVQAQVAEWLASIK